MNASPLGRAEFGFKTADAPSKLHKRFNSLLTEDLIAWLPLLSPHFTAYSIYSHNFTYESYYRQYSATMAEEIDLYGTSSHPRKSLSTNR